MSFTSLIPSFLPDGISSRFDFQALLDQRGRLLQVHTALPTLALIPERMVMREAVSQPFELVIDCLSTSAHFELKQLLGEQVSVGLLQPTGQYKPWHGYVFEAAQLGADGALARYRLVLKPWMCCLEHSLNSRVFESKTARDIIEEVFAAYPEAQFRFEVTDTLRLRSTCTQFRESDLAFVQRLLAEEGLSYHFEHAADGAELVGASSALHTLVITDRAAPRPSLGPTRFAAQHPTAFIQGQKDAITAFKTQRRLQPNAVALGSWNYRELVGSSATLATALEQGDVPTLEVYDGSGAYRYENTAHAQRATELALGALELQTKTFEGQGSTRHFEAGRQFSLIDHPLYGAGLTEGLGGVIKAVLDAPATLLAGREDNRFTLLAVEHHAANNLGSEAAALLGLSAIERGSYRNQFHAAPAAAPVLPRFARKPTAPGAQTALVVGLDGDALNTDRDHRVKIRFYWQDEQDGNSGTWVRVLSPQAGANWGAVFTPRIGTEVLVEFIEGDIDRPVITAALYNGQDRPPFSAGVDSGVNHPGTLSGLHSHSLDQSGFNQWVLDDATAQVRMRLLCSYSAAEVGLGHLIQQAAHTAQRGAWRGSGFEAATRAWASLRSSKGLLISTTARPGSYGSAECSNIGTQMDATEAVAQLKGAQDLAQRLSQAAQTGQAQALTAHAESIPALIKTLDPEQDGKITAAINGQEAQKAQGRDLTEPVEAPSTPTILLDTPSSQAWLSDASIASYAGRDLARVAQGDQHEAAAHTHATVAGQTVSLYTHAGGITAHAANGPVSLRAHTDELQILADQDVTILSVNGEIHINAQSKIELIGADSAVILDGGDITFVTPGTWEAKGATQAMLGGSSGNAVLPELPSQRVAALGQQPGQLQSTFARDQLQRFAQEADEASFVIEMASIFGVDVPLSAYQRLYQEAKAGLRLPLYKVAFGGSAEYDAAQDCFWVDESLACRAARNEPRAAWQLLQALLQAWGQYVAHQLRAVWSEQGAAPMGQTYALSLLDLAQTTSTTIAELQHPEISGSIVVQHSEPRRVARLQTQHYQDATQAAGADGVMLHDGVYRPERDGGFKVVPVFDAKMMKDDPHPGVHNHHTIEQTLLGDDFFSVEEVGYIYYGNWLRDWSQMCDSFMLPPGIKGMGLSREHITTAVMLMGQVVATTYIKGGAWDKARGFIEFKKANLQQCMERLGCYRPEEHMDNPAGLPSSREHRYPPGWLVDLPIAKRLLEVNPATGLRRYIGDADQTGAYPSSLVYMQRQLSQACALGRTPAGLMHLGFALHVLEDYFAHTNFVELALVKAGSREVVTWVPFNEDLFKRPITTGQFTSQDIYYSLTYKLSDLLLPASQTNERMGKLHYDGLELADWVVWALLTDAGRTWTAAAFKANCLVMYQAAELAKGAVPEVVQKGVAQARNWAYGYVAAGLKTQVAGRVRAAQIDHYDFASSMDPTHTMLAKDANDHPLHDLAATLAREAVADVGRCIQRFWQGQGSSAEVLACAGKYFVHPARSSLFDEDVAKWAGAHKAQVNAASSQSEALKRAKEHQHGGHHDEHRHLPQQFDQMWAFTGQHYAQLFGQDDLTSGLDAGDFA